MIPTSLSQSTDNHQQGSDFRVLRWQLEWWILPEGKTLHGIAERRDLLVAKSLPVKSPPFKWGFLEWPEATQFKTFSLSNHFQEELKASLRKKFHIKGNCKYPFFFLREKQLQFEPFVVTYPDHSIALYFRTSPQSLPISTLDLVSLSTQPLQDNSSLRMAADKIFAVLQGGDINSRPVGKIKYRSYPYIHIFDYSPASENAFASATVPWHEFVQIGTRHMDISPGDQKLIGHYKAKNHSLRDGVLVIDKQSTLVVSPKNYLELQGIRYCLAIALRMRHLLEEHFRDNSETSCLDKKLLQRLRFACENPSVITSSYNYQTIWPLIVRECKVIEWMLNVESNPNRELVEYLPEAELQKNEMAKKLMLVNGHDGVSITTPSPSPEAQINNGHDNTYDNGGESTEKIPTPYKADITILTILPEEYQAVCSKLIALQPAEQLRDHANLYAWKVGRVNCFNGAYTVAVGMIGRAGTTESALATTDAIKRWDPNFIFFVGIAGGLKDVRKGDIVIADIIHGYEYGKIEHGTFIPRSNWTYKTDIGLFNGAVVHTLEDWQKNISVLPPTPTVPKAIPGEIASGDKVVDDPSYDFFASVLKAWPKMVAIEMEGAGAANAIEQTHALGKRANYIMIRGISDLPRSTDAETLADSTGGTLERDSWKSYAADTAAAFAVSFIASGLPLPPSKKS